MATVILTIPPNEKVSPGAESAPLYRFDSPDHKTAVLSQNEGSSWPEIPARSERFVYRITAEEDLQAENIVLTKDGIACRSVNTKNMPLSISLP